MSKSVNQIKPMETLITHSALASKQEIARNTPPPQTKQTHASVGDPSTQRIILNYGKMSDDELIPHLSSISYTLHLIKQSQEAEAAHIASQKAEEEARIHRQTDALTLLGDYVGEEEEELSEVPKSYVYAQPKKSEASAVPQKMGASAVQQRTTRSAVAQPKDQVKNVLSMEGITDIYSFQQIKDFYPEEVKSKKKTSFFEKTHTPPIHTPS